MLGTMIRDVWSLLALASACIAHCQLALSRFPKCLMKKKRKLLPALMNDELRVLSMPADSDAMWPGSC